MLVVIYLRVTARLKEEIRAELEASDGGERPGRFRRFPRRSRYVEP